MSSYVVGQRFVSEAEPELGLGRVERVEKRHIVLRFPASDTVRHYALGSAPLKRVRFRAGDAIEDTAGRRFRVEEIEEQGGLLLYRGGGAKVAESELSGALRFSKPEERLLAGFWDENRVFDLRHRTLHHQHAIRESPVRGFLGGRIELIPHQLYISSEVASRPYPRALLADEVGLGKTIEAGLILHRLLRSGQISRALILVPEPLVHQWFVEMFRRFHLSFTLIDEDHCRAVEAGSPDANPFRGVSTVITSLGLVGGHGGRAAQIEDAGWDMLVVDEAHHLRWSEEAPSPEYRLVESIARKSPGLLLLTATPEQLGGESHFARLRLLDPDRYASYRAYREEAARYRQVADVAAKLVDGKSLDEEDVAALDEALPPAATSLRERMKSVLAGEASERERFIAELTDQHGPGRVIFRNSRKVLGQFPERRTRPAKLAWPSEPRSQYDRLARELVADARQAGLSAATDVYLEDVRARWLVALVRELAPEKALVICRFERMAVALHEALRHGGIPSGLFHERLSLLQRDRNAAWFADEREGAQVLVCSEIGSEGRNFQFAHHLVLFDLPFSPELLEQRIGRLARIGQERTVEIHVPYLPGSPQEMLFLWYDEGLNAFESPVPSGVDFDELVARLRNLALEHLERSDPWTMASPPAELGGILEETRARYEQISRELEAGRDRLLELSSFRPREAEALLSEIRTWDESRELDGYLRDALDYVGAELEQFAPRSFVFRQGNQLVVDALPGLRAGEVAMTADRFKATHQAELDFLTWDHPMVTGVMELLAGGEHGNSAVAILSSQGREALLLEAIFVLDAVAPPELFVDRFLPPTPLRFLVDARPSDVSLRYPSSELAGRLRDGRRAFRYRLTSSWDELVPRMIDKTRSLAEAERPRRVAASLARMRESLEMERHRLRALREVNDLVRPEEIERIEEEMEDLESAIGSATLRLDSLRLIWKTSEPPGV